MASREEIAARAEELNANLPLNNEVLPGSTEWSTTGQRRVPSRVTPLSARDARRLIKSRLWQLFGVDEVPDPLEADSATAALYKDISDLAEVIVYALPEEAMGETTLRGLDLRSYVQYAAVSTVTGDQESAGTLNMPELAARWEEQQAVLPEPYRPTGDVRLTPEAKGEIEGLEGMSGVAPTSLEQAVAGYGVMPGVAPRSLDMSGVREMVEAGLMSFEQAITDPNLAPISVDLTGTPTPGLRAWGNPAKARPMSSIGALRYLNDLDERQVANLQDVMERAGYFTSIGRDPQTNVMTMADIPYERGYSNDTTTIQAWRAVIQDAWVQNKPVMTLLREKAVEFQQRETALRQQLTEQRLTQFQSALGNTRQVADRMALDTLGRRLSPTEYVQVREYLRSLQKERIAEIPGDESAPWMSEAPQAGFTEEDIATGVAETLEPETQMRTGMAANRQLKKWLGID